MKTNVVFSHANGFPAKSYRQFLNFLEGTYLKYINIYGMGKFPIDVNWRSSVHELIDFVEREFSGPVTALGHSFGGAISILAAALRPELFDQVIAIDPPLFAKKKRWAIGIMRLISMEEWVFPLSQMAKIRRSYFHSRAEALEYFQGKSFFKKFHPECLKDYIKYGLTEVGEGFELTIPAQMESDIFRLIPCFFIPNLSQIKSCTILYATIRTQAFNQNDLEWLQKNIKHIRMMPCAVSHMAPFENPQLMAKLVNDIVR